MTEKAFQFVQSHSHIIIGIAAVELLLFVIGAAGVGGYLYIKMKGVKPASKKNELDPDADYQDEDKDALQLPEDDGDEDEEVDVNEDYEAESDDEPV